LKDFFFLGQEFLLDDSRILQKKMTSQATARLARELKDLMKNPISGFKVELANEGNLFEWHVFIQGPKETPQENGIFLKPYLLFRTIIQIHPQK